MCINPQNAKRLRVKSGCQIRYPSEFPQPFPNKNALFRTIIKCSNDCRCQARCANCVCANDSSHIHDEMPQSKAIKIIDKNNLD